MNIHEIRAELKTLNQAIDEQDDLIRPLRLVLEALELERNQVAKELCRLNREEAEVNKVRRFHVNGKPKTNPEFNAKETVNKLSREQMQEMLDELEKMMKGKV